MSTRYPGDMAHPVDFREMYFWEPPNIYLCLVYVVNGLRHLAYGYYDMSIYCLGHVLNNFWICIIYIATCSPPFGICYN